MEKKKTSKAILNFWGTGRFGNSIYSYLGTAFFTMFLTDVALFPVAIVSVILTFTSIVNFFLAPAMGMFINMSKPLKWGRVRSWIILGPVLMLPFGVMQYYPMGSGWGAALVLMAIYVIAHAFFQLGYAADTAMIPIVADSEQTRLKLSSNCMVGSNLGRLANSYITPTAVAFLTARSILEENKTYAMLAFVFGLIYILGSFIEFKMTKGYESTDKEGDDHKIEVDDTLKFKDIVDTLKVNKYLPALIVADLGSNIGSFVIPTLNTYYYKYVAPGIPNVGLAMHLVITGICGLIGAKLAGSVFKNAKDRRKLLLCIYLVVTVFCVLSRLVALTNGYLFVAFQGIMQMCIGMSQPFEMSLYTDTIIYHRWKTKKDATSFIMGMSAFPGNIASVIRSIIISVTLASTGYVAGMEITQALRVGFANAYVIVPGVVPIISFVALAFFFKLTPEMVRKMEKEIREEGK